MKPSSKVIAGKRSSRPAPPITRASVSDGKTERSVSVRKIENGYIISESTCGPKGYSSKETFSTKPPTVQVQPTKGRK